VSKTVGVPGSDALGRGDVMVVEREGAVQCSPCRNSDMNLATADAKAICKPHRTNR
jgi:hypothetical protein